jgi:hypothetical protein
MLVLLMFIMSKATTDQHACVPCRCKLVAMQRCVFHSSNAAHLLPWIDKKTCSVLNWSCTWSSILLIISSTSPARAAPMCVDAEAQAMLP